MHNPHLPQRTKTGALGALVCQLLRVLVPRIAAPVDTAAWRRERVAATLDVTCEGDAHSDAINDNGRGCVDGRLA